MVGLYRSTDASKQPIRTSYLGHVTGYQPMRDQYFLIRSVPGIQDTLFRILSKFEIHFGFDIFVTRYIGLSISTRVGVNSSRDREREREPTRFISHTISTHQIPAWNGRKAD
eukprot:sb/3477048/